MPPHVLYTDGGSLGNGQVNQRARMAVFDGARGGIVVDQDLGGLTNNEAEYRAIEAALDYAMREQLAPIEIRSDSLLCVSQIRGEWKVKEPRLRPHVERCRAKLAALSGAISWVPRSANPAGHHLEGAAAPVSDEPSIDAGSSVEHADSSEGARFCIRCGQGLRERTVDHRSRPACPACGWTYFQDPKVAVAAVLAVDDGIVLCRRAIEPGLGRWSFPAGFVDRGEDLRRALEREVEEETGLTARLQDLVGVYSEVGNPVVLVVYAAEARGVPRPSAEASAVGVFRPSDLPELAFAHDHQIVADWQTAQSRAREATRV